MCVRDESKSLAPLRSSSFPTQPLATELFPSIAYSATPHDPAFIPRALPRTHASASTNIAKHSLAAVNIFCSPTRRLSPFSPSIQ